jgi:aspartate carbamoyltransferase catalytic subunit
MVKDLKGKDILHGGQFSRDQLEGIMEITDAFRKRLEKEHSLDLLKGYVLGAIFFEPTRAPAFIRDSDAPPGGSFLVSPPQSTSAKANTADTIIR